MKQVLHQSVRQIAQTIIDKELSSLEVVDTFIARIHEVNPKLNAVVQLCEESARCEAEKADRALSSGVVLGPLHGVPMTLKDSFDAAGVISSGGTLGRKDYVPAKDATVLSRLRGSGAILLGKTNTPEFTLKYETNNLVYGRTNNPYDQARSPGGSSGGAAAIVASAGSPFDIGSDYGGSLRYPAHCCGVTSIKPTSGRVPRTGHILPFGGALDSFQQIGPIGKCVDDLRLILPLISGTDWVDPSIIPMPEMSSEEKDLPGLRICFHTDNGIQSASPETVEYIERVASVLAKSGMEVHEIRPSGIEESYDIMMSLLSADGGASIRRLLQEAKTQEHSIPWLGLGEPLDARALDALIMRWFRFKSSMTQFMKDYDIILSPVHSVPAQTHGAIRGDLRGFSYTMAYNLTGWPVVTLRVGTSQEGLPIGCQVVSRPWREDVALLVAEGIEKAIGPFALPPI